MAEHPKKGRAHGHDAAAHWQKEKLLASQLIGVSTGRSFLDTLPDMLEFWVFESVRDKAAPAACPGELSFELLKSLSETCPFHFGNDIKIMAVLPDIVRDVSNIEESTLKAQYDAAIRRLPMIDDTSPPFPGDVTDIDQLLIPALLGGSVPLKQSHAQEVKKHLNRNDDVTALKLLSMYAIKDDVHFSARLPGAFLPAALQQRLVSAVKTPQDSRFLYAAMKGLGCIGPLTSPSAGAGGEKVRHGTPPPGFKPRCATETQSLALRYARDLDDDLESLSLFSSRSCK